MPNPLYRAILDKIRRIPRFMPGSRPTLRAGSPVTIPFAPGRIYRAAYANYKHDPRPLVFILSSNAFYTHGINIHYLGGLQRVLMQIIVNMRRSNQPLTGMIMYKFLKMKSPGIPKAGYRLYFTKYLAGKLVSDGVSQIPMPDKERFVAEPFINALNQMIRPRVIGKVYMNPQEAERLKSEMSEASIAADQTTIGRH
jgi:hypothetical protein